MLSQTFIVQRPEWNHYDLDFLAQEKRLRDLIDYLEKQRIRVSRVNSSKRISFLKNPYEVKSPVIESEIPLETIDISAIRKPHILEFILQVEQRNFPIELSVREGNLKDIRVYLTPLKEQEDFYEHFAKVSSVVKNYYQKEKPPRF